MPRTRRIQLIHKDHESASRRRFLGAAGAVLCCGSFGFTVRAQDVDSLHGRVRPALPLPDFDLTLANGTTTTLHKVLGDRATAVQLMFTACRTTCPMQGAIFERVQSLIPDQVERGLQLLSLSVNASGEEPGAMTTWLNRFHAQNGWVAAAPAAKDLPAVRRLFGQGRSPNDPHSTQVQIVDRHQQLIWRTSELPAASEIAAMLGKL